MIRSAIAHGLDAIVFTNHDRLVTPARLEALNARYTPFRIFGGVEVTLDSEHIIVLGIHDPALELGSEETPPGAAPTHWEYPDLYKFVRERDGLIILCHPFRYRPEISIDVEQYPPDAIEVHSRNTPNWAESQIRETARKVGAKLLSNSDAHHKQSLGDFYNQLRYSVQTMSALLTVLRSGEFNAIRREAPLAA